MPMLLEKLSPSNIPKKRSDWSVYITFYNWLLKKLAKRYSCGAVYDTIQIGETTFIHSVRDNWFEQELKRFNLPTKVTINCQSVPYFITNKYFQSCFFNWTESLVVYYGEKGYGITRNKTTSIEANLIGKIKTSKPNDLVAVTEFTAEIKKATPVTVVNSKPQDGQQQKKEPQKEPEKKPENKPEKNQPVKSNPLGREKREPKPKPKQPQRPQQQEQPKTPIVNNNGNDSNTIKRGKINIDLTF